MKNNKQEILLALTEVEDTLKESYDLIDTLNGNLHDLLEKLGSSEHTCECSQQSYSGVNDFYMSLPTYGCMDMLMATLNNIKEEIAKEV